MIIYNSVILPHFLYGCKTWNCSSDHLTSLESFHSKCERHIMGVTVRDRHSLKHIYDVFGSQPVFDS